MKTTVTSKGQLTLPREVRDRLAIDTGTVLEVEIGEGGTVLLRKQAAPGFFDQFVGLKAKEAPYESGDEARESLRVAEGEARYPTKSSKRRPR